eukprot:scaffold160130_cov15-Prasinocladus_malaysianus.AAC.1
MSAQIRNDTLDVFVKFPCIPTPPNLQAASRVDPHHRCRNGINDDDEVHTAAPILVHRIEPQYRVVMDLMDKICLPCKALSFHRNCV